MLLWRDSNDAVLEEFVQARVTGVAIEAGTKNRVDKKKQILGNHRKEVPRSRDSSDNREDPRKGGVQGRGEAAQQKYEKVAKPTGAHFHTPKLFTVGGSGEKDDLTGGLHTDGLHPNPEYLQRYSEDLYDALKTLF